ncbi:MAG TPA: sortase [Anaerolineae bacterium]|nr:sortase [Anaerolineae bacterium]
MAFGFGLCAMLSACRPATTTPAAFPPYPSPRPTWTPTPTAAFPHNPTATRASGPTSTPTPFSLPTATPRPRVDAAGPWTIPTVAPLPSGQGRVPVRVRIPKVGLDAPIEPMGWHWVEDARGRRTEWDVPRFAAGHHIDSAFPGELGNMVLSGHHNIGGAVFAPIATIGEPDNPLALGDTIIVEDALGRQFTYRITSWRRFPEANASVAVRRENASYLLPTDFPQLTLITCWPLESNTHRVIITAALTQIHPP